MLWPVQRRCCVLIIVYNFRMRISEKIVLCGVSTEMGKHKTEQQKEISLQLKLN